MIKLQDLTLKRYRFKIQNKNDFYYDNLRVSHNRSKESFR